MRSHLFVAVLTAAALAGLPGLAQETDPPVRVGRVASVTGAVSFHLAGAERWDRASLNLPLTDGAALWTQPGAAATIGVGGNRIVLDAATEFDLDRLGEHALVATQPQGESYWRVLTLPSGDSATVQTPRGIVAFAAAGRYEVVSGDTEHPTEITVLEGSAKVTGLSADVEIGPNQAVTITGDGAGTPFVATVRAVVRDAFLLRVLAAERPPARQVALPPAVALMTGSEILAEEGDWNESPEYGPVWYPPAPAGFVPYRDGHWAYVAPWGWTWVDDAPWGFAPTHYGRWAEIGGRWGWVPGREWAPERPPVYAPALVAFIAGAAAGSWVGWAPLGPHEAFRPAYHASPRYAEALNRPTGANVNVTVINRQAVTVVPAQAMTNSVNVARAFRAAPALPATQAVQFRAPVAPTHATVGATPAVLREVAPREMEAPARQAAPGPAIGPGHGGEALLGGAAVGGAAAMLLRPSAPRAALPELRPHGVMRSAVPGAPFAPSPSGPTTPSAPAAPQAPTLPRQQAVAPVPERHAPREDILGQPSPQPLLRPEQARPTSPRPEPAHIAAPHLEAPRPEAARVEPPHAPPRPEAARIEPPRPRPEPPRPAPVERLAPIRQPAPAAFRPPPPRPEAPRAEPARQPPPREHRGEQDRRRPP